MLQQKHQQLHTMCINLFIAAVFCSLPGTSDTTKKNRVVMHSATFGFLHTNMSRRLCFTFPSVCSSLSSSVLTLAEIWCFKQVLSRKFKTVFCSDTQTKKTTHNQTSPVARRKCRHCALLQTMNVLHLYVLY